ncbi:alcohol dehydrogenase catalytic domain-containing protein [Pyrobaculum neutrophilum]|uniref:Alcohol dehydrogenase GroES domain protein n=1 Tax=Pyrobaculum neutrophilum (strain DSM 2338 / JCM 9278 / NBRC 100436 / V24Sta) TaxID=444157 RepID=B1YD61_PYRNV|nr:alcohol dehydrogenase catalytic domain-containing protein [Pyrobaculum neutrophilum]ACB39724.1 Alcohol dehydrogenase GroES domain protein [Pyrobaculum neutrophilum V24Sta]
MRGYLLGKFGEPPALVELEKPRAAPGRVVVKVAAAGVCYRDFLTWRGLQRARLPVVPGHEFAGVVEEVGEGVAEFKPGDAVAGMMYEYCGVCENCRSGREYLCRSRRIYGEDLHGAFAEYISVDRKSLVKIPPGVPLEAASFAACVLSTVVRGVRKIGVAPGMRVLVTGAGGGVGIHAVQIAKAYGAKVIAVTSPSKAEAVGKYADYVISEKAFSEEVKKLGGADGAVEAVGGPTLEQTVRSLNWGARVALIGNVDPQPAPLPLGLLILKEVEILPVIQGGRRDLEEALRLLASGAVKPVYTVHSFSELPKLIAETPNATHIGRRVVKIDI